MTTRQYLRQMLSERRDHSPNSAEYRWRTRAALKFIAIIRGVPTEEWP